MKKQIACIVLSLSILLMSLTSACAKNTLEEHSKHNYLQEMIEYCAEGKTFHGRASAAKRIKKQNMLGDQSPRIDFDEMYLLAKVIESEAGCVWLSVDWKTMVGEVLINRVDSPEFPDTLKECVYQSGQYSNVKSRAFKKLKPSIDSATAAARLLNGTRLINDPSVVFQANFKQGSGVAIVLSDDKLGKTYLCYSYNMHLYN